MKALGEIVLIKPAQVKMTASGLHLPDKQRNMLDRGEVRDIGPGVPEGMLEVGDMVHYNPGAVGAMGGREVAQELVAIGYKFIITKEEKSDGVA